MKINDIQDAKTLLCALRAAPESTLTHVFNLNRAKLRRLVDARLDRRVRGRIDPSDVVQETLVEANRRIDDYLGNPHLSFERWLMMLAEQNAIAAHRRHVSTKKRSVDREAVGADASGAELPEHKISQKQSDPSLRMIRIERITLLRKAIAQLSVPDRNAIQLRFFEGLTIPEIANRENISADAASKRTIRALRRLNTHAQRFGVELTDSESSTD